MLLTPRFSTALAFTHELHGKQKRKGGDIPYIAHLLTVASLVIEAGGDEDTAIAALLHDAVEDQGGKPTLERIRDRYGNRVADMVEACSDTDVDPKPEWRQRKEKYVDAVPNKSPEALLVSLADKVHNAEAILADYKTMGDDLWDIFTGKKDGTLWYYRSLRDAFEGRTPPALWGRLNAAVTELDRMVAAG